MILNPPLRDIARLKTDSKYQAVTNPNTVRYYTAGWNVNSSPLNNKLEVKTSHTPAGTDTDD